MRFLSLLVVLNWTSAVSAEEFVWRSTDGLVLPNSEHQKSIQGFGAKLLITSDQNWRAKWHAGAQTFADFSVTQELAIGDTVTILPFYANPQLDLISGVKILCAASITRPSGLYAFKQSDFECVSGVLATPAEHIHLSPALLNFTAEAGDELGIWTVNYRFTDQLRNISVSLNRHFTLVEPPKE